MRPTVGPLRKRYGRVEVSRFNVTCPLCGERFSGLVGARDPLQMLCPGCLALRVVVSPNQRHDDFRVDLERTDPPQQIFSDDARLDAWAAEGGA